MRTDEKLKELSDELQKNCGDLHAACRACGVSPHFVMTWMRDDPEASKVLDEAQKVGWLGIETEIVRRAITGVDEAVYYKGFKVDTKKVYSDTLLVKLAEARVPAYKKGESSNPTFNGPTQINVMPRAENFEQWLAMKDATLARRVDALPAPKIPAILQGDFIEVPNNPMKCLEGLL